MPLAVTFVALVAIATAALASWRLRRARARIEELERALLEPGAHERIRDVITVEIRNHAGVAAARNRMARAVAAVSPGMIRSIVHKEASRMMRDELAANGVVADVTVRRIAVPAESPLERGGHRGRPMGVDDGQVDSAGPAPTETDDAI